VNADRLGAVLWVAQRASAAVLALCVVVHLATIVLAMQGGLTASEILARTRGNAGMLAFYLVFALAVSIHAPIGLRTIVAEWTGWRGRSLDLATLLLAVALLASGIHAMLALYR
jgi:fumarate reductase subunit C